MTTLSVASHPYCLRCGSIVPALFDPAVQYEDHMYHLSCATKTILEKSILPYEPPRQELPPNPFPRF
jgi:hypothetical protein